MVNQIETIVGTGIGGQRNIIEAIKNEGFRVKSAGNGRQWPREHYVCYNGKYIRRGENSGPNWNPFGEGGNLRFGDEFLLVSDRVYDSDNMRRQLGEQIDYEKVKQLIIQEGEKQFPRTRIHVAPTGYFHKGKGHEHIDMFTLLLPKNRVLILDTHFGKCAGKAKEYDEIAEAEQLKLIRYDGSQDGVWYPLNSLVLPDGNSDIVFTDSKALSLIKLLEQEGIKSIGVDMPQHTYPAGKINCQTNIYNFGDNVEEYLEEF